MTDEFQKILDFDALAQAERLTGQSYKEDKMTEVIGLHLHLQSVQRKKEELALRGDTYFSMKFKELLKIYGELGFVDVHSHSFTNTYGNTDDFVVLWHPEGILATAESYTFGVEDREPVVNNTKIYFNWKPNDQDAPWSFPMSGRIVAGVWVGNIDVREGLRHYLSRFRSEGSFVNPWLERDFMWLVDYSQAKVEGYDHKAITNGVLDTLPTEVKDSILYARSEE